MVGLQRMCGISRDDIELWFAFNAFFLEHVDKGIHERWPLPVMGTSFLEDKVFGIVGFTFRAKVENAQIIVWFLVNSRESMEHCHYHNINVVLCKPK